ncbi:segregation and condensation protein A [Halarchaeum acidiphilum MH1-52-1]|uniref:Segregation and condensation protein A n=1 Tax=Halarchaeum acidiphilum MH1-52-1 TaxID=1261545 RepID=U2YDH0_9EURY|nr:ScpA family protein [Halarchaeum acidiphilum]GAD51726.1 segregation and condensation protein A [Halarchaeum acidiphilum MH1-52-1]
MTSDGFEPPEAAKKPSEKRALNESEARAGRDDPRAGEADRLCADGGNPEDAFTLSGHESDGSDLSLGDEPEDPEPEGGDADGEEVEPVELLVQLAKEGEIEPWDIDIVDVTDAFLDKLDEADLRTSGRALFYASVLLRMKSDALLEPDEPAEPDEAEPAGWDDWERGMDEPPADAPGVDPIAALEDEMDRRLERKPQRGTPETLDELVRSLREAERESWWKESRSYDTSASPQGFQRGVQELDYRSGDDFRMEEEPSAADVTDTAHGEDIEATIDAVEDALAARYDRGRGEVLFAEVTDAGDSRVESFLAVLFLAHRGRVTLEQDELFGDLWVVDA